VTDEQILDQYTAQQQFSQGLDQAADKFTLANRQVAAPPPADLTSNAPDTGDQAVLQGAPVAPESQTVTPETGVVLPSPEQQQEEAPEPVDSSGSDQAILDAYSQENQPQIQQAVADNARQILNEADQGMRPDLSFRRRYELTKLAGKNKGLLGRTGDTTNQVVDDISQAHVGDWLSGVASMGKDFLKKNYDAASQLLMHPGTLKSYTDFYDRFHMRDNPIDMAAGMLGGGAQVAQLLPEIASLAQQAHVALSPTKLAELGAARILGAPPAPESEGEVNQDALLNSVTGLMREHANIAQHGVEQLADVDTSSPSYQAGQLAPWAVAPGGEVLGAGPDVAKAIDAITNFGARTGGSAIDLAAQGLKVPARGVAKVAPTAAVAAGLGHFNPYYAVGALLGYGRLARAGRALADIISKPFDYVAAVGRTIADSPNAGTYSQAAINLIDKNLVDENARLAFLKDGLTDKEQQALNATTPTGEPMVETEDLPDKLAKIRAKEDEIYGLNKKRKLFEGIQQTNQVVSDGVKYGLNVGAHVVGAAAVGGALGALDSEPGDAEAIEQGAKTTAVLGGAVAPFAARAGGLHLNADKLERQGIEAAKANPDYEQHQSLLDTLHPSFRRLLNVISGYGAAGGKPPTIILRSGDFVKAAEREGQGVVSPTTRGFSTPNGNYVNADAFEMKGLLHEVIHGSGLDHDPVFVDAAEKMWAENPEKALAAVNKYRAGLGKTLIPQMPGEKGFVLQGDNIPKGEVLPTGEVAPEMSREDVIHEMAAALGADMLSSLPPENLYGGRSIGQGVASWLKNKLGNKDLTYTEQYGFPVTHEMRRAMENALFEQGRTARFGAKTSAPEAAPEAEGASDDNGGGGEGPPGGPGSPPAGPAGAGAVETPQFVQDAAAALQALRYGTKAEALAAAQAGAAQGLDNANDIILWAQRNRAKGIPAINEGGEDNASKKPSGKSVDLRKQGRAVGPKPPLQQQRPAPEIRPETPAAPPPVEPKGEGAAQPEVNEPPNQEAKSAIPEVANEAAPEPGVAPVVSQAVNEKPASAIPEIKDEVTPEELAAVEDLEKGGAEEAKFARAQAGIPEIKPGEKVEPVDYDAIRKEAEEAKRQELANSKRKSKEGDIARAGIEAAAKAHAKNHGALLPAESMPVHNKDGIYSKLMGKGIPVGPNLYELKDSQVTPSLRNKLDFRGRPEETAAFYLKPKADVTGNPYDRGWILKDKRPDYLARFANENTDKAGGGAGRTAENSEGHTALAEGNEQASPDAGATRGFLPESEKEAKVIGAGAGQNQPTDLVTYREDRFGRTNKAGQVIGSIGGQRIDPTDPFHKMLLKAANYSAADLKRLQFLQNNIGKSVTVDYMHAAEQGKINKAARVKDQEQAPAQERVAGNVPKRRLVKSIVPTWIKFNTPSNTLQVLGFAPDKFLLNAKKSIEWAQKNLPGWDEKSYRSQVKKGAPPVGWASVNDPAFIKDAHDAFENHAHGYTFSGRPISGTPFTNVTPDPNYTPHIIGKDRADMLNLMMGNEEAATSYDKSGNALPPNTKKADALILAQKNSPYIPDATGETNRLRQMMTNKGVDLGLENTVENVEPKLIEKPRIATVDDKLTIRPTGFKGDRAQLTSDGIPSQHYAAGGFLPASEVLDNNIKRSERYLEQRKAQLRELPSGDPHRLWIQQRIDDIENQLSLAHASKDVGIAVEHWQTGLGKDWATPSVFFGPAGIGYTDYGPDRIPAVIKKDANLYDGESSYQYLEEQGLHDKKDPLVLQMSGADLTPKQLVEGDYSDDIDRNIMGPHKTATGIHNPEFSVPQQIAMRELKKQGYDGAHWKYEDDLSPEQYQIWNKNVLKFMPQSELPASVINAEAKAAPELRSGAFLPSKDPDAIKSPAVKFANGKVKEGSWHEGILEDNPGYGPGIDGFTTNSGEFLTRTKAYRRAVALKQLSARPGIMAKIAENIAGMESMDFTANRKFLPQDNAQTETPEFKKWFGNSSLKDDKGNPIPLYHGTKEDYPADQIDVGKRMFGIHLATDKNAAEKYGEVRTYEIAPNAKILDLSDGEELWHYMQKSGILDKEDLKNPDLYNYVTGGQVFQYDISSRTHFADDVAKTAKSQGYDVIKMLDDLGSYEDGGNIAHVVVNPEVLKPYSSFLPAQEPFYSQLQRTIEDQPDKASPEQIKSATGNSGAFDPSNPDIRFLPQSDNPRAIAGPALRMPDGKVIFVRHGMHLNLIKKVDEVYGDKADEMLAGARSGWATNGKEFLSHDDAMQRALEVGQITKEDYAKAEKRTGAPSPGTGLESLAFAGSRKFLPSSSSIPALSSDDLSAKASPARSSRIPDVVPVHRDKRMVEMAQ
jgi:ADP-Ribosyltransferase in polyvalent proteins